MTEQSKIQNRKWLDDTAGAGQGDKVIKCFRFSIADFGLRRICMTKIFWARIFGFHYDNPKSELPAGNVIMIK